MLLAVLSLGALETVPNRSFSDFGSYLDGHSFASTTLEDNKDGVDAVYFIMLVCKFQKDQGSRTSSKFRLIDIS